MKSKKVVVSYTGGWRDGGEISSEDPNTSKDALLWFFDDDKINLDKNVVGLQNRELSQDFIKIREGNSAKGRPHSYIYEIISREDSEDIIFLKAEFKGFYT